MHKASHASKTNKLLLILALVLAVFLLAGCQGEVEEDTAVSPEPATTEIQTPAEENPQIAALSQEEEALIEEEVAPVDECLNCHIDKDMLIQTANPEEEVISENEGEG